MVSISKAVAEKIRMEAGMMIYTSCSPFALVKNKHFIEMFNLLGISHACPSEQEIRCRILDELYEKAEEKRDSMIKAAEKIILSMDTTTKLTKTTALNTIALLPEPVLVSSEEVREKKDTAFYYKKFVAAMDASGERVIAVITDGEAVMLAGLAMMHKYHPHVVGLRCFSHLVNLFVKEDVSRVASIEQIVGTIKKICKTIMHSNILAGQFRTAMTAIVGSVFPSLPGMRRRII